MTPLDLAELHAAMHDESLPLLIRTDAAEELGEQAVADKMRKSAVSPLRPTNRRHESLATRKRVQAAIDGLVMGHQHTLARLLRRDATMARDWLAAHGLPRRFAGRISAAPYWEPEECTRPQPTAYFSNPESTHA